jgi:phage gp16-like protein
MAKNQKLSAAQKLAINQANVQKIHIAKKQLGLDDVTYKEMLKGLTGKESTAELNWQQLELVVQTLKAKGFKPIKVVKKGGDCDQSTT